MQMRTLVYGSLSSTAIGYSADPVARISLGANLVVKCLTKPSCAPARQKVGECR